MLRRSRNRECSGEIIELDVGKKHPMEKDKKLTERRNTPCERPYSTRAPTLTVAIMALSRSSGSSMLRCSRSRESVAENHRVGCW